MTDGSEEFLSAFVGFSICYSAPPGSNTMVVGVMRLAMEGFAWFTMDVKLGSH